MRVLLQRVSRACVRVEQEVVGEIGPGLLIFLGAGEGDGPQDLDYILSKSLNLRIFSDADGKMNHSVLDIGAQVLVVSQFTLYAQTRRGRRPSFVDALEPGAAEQFYETFLARVRDEVGHVECGKFGANMDVELVNDGPVTIWIDSADR